MTRPWPIVAALLCLLAPATGLAEEGGDLEWAMEHDRRAQEHFEGGEYRQALRELEAAQARLPSTARLYNLAVCAERAGLPERAIRHYRDYLEAPDGDEALQAGIRTSITELQAEIDRGPEQEGPTTTETETGEPGTGGEGPAPEEERRGLRPAAFYSTLGVTLALGAAATALGVVTLVWRAEFNGLTREDPRAQTLADEGPPIALAADIMIGLTAAAAAATVVLAILTSWSPETPAADGGGASASRTSFGPGWARIAF